jgi:hypothetical protein
VADIGPSQLPRPAPDASPTPDADRIAGRVVADADADAGH